MHVGHRAGAAPKRSVSSGIVVVAIVALVVVVGLIGYMNLKPGAAREKAPAKSAITIWIEQKAAESGGDINRLNPEDQQKLQRVSRGQGAMMLKALAPKK